VALDVLMVRSVAGYRRGTLTWRGRPVGGVATTAPTAPTAPPGSAPPGPATMST